MTFLKNIKIIILTSDKTLTRNVTIEMLLKIWFTIWLFWYFHQIINKVNVVKLSNDKQFSANRSTIKSNLIYFNMKIESENSKYLYSDEKFVITGTVIYALSNTTRIWSLTLRFVYVAHFLWLNRGNVPLTISFRLFIFFSPRVIRNFRAYTVGNIIYENVSSTDYPTSSALTLRRVHNRNGYLCATCVCITIIMLS